MRYQVVVLTLPAADNKAGHQKDKDNNPPSDGHNQNGRLVWIPNGQDIWKQENRTFIFIYLSKHKRKWKPLQGDFVRRKVTRGKIKGCWKLKRRQVRQQSGTEKDGESMKYDCNRKEIKDGG